jgi:hypothetical protein
MPPRDVRIGETDVALLRPAQEGTRARELMPRAVDGERDGRRRLVGRLFVRAVDHRRAGLGLGGEVLGRAFDLRHPGRDSELADLEVVVSLHEHLRAGEDGVLLAVRVLRQILLQLCEERALVRLELLPVLRAEVHRVLVGDVDARDRDDAVVVHLLRQLAGELDRLDVRAERAAEEALEQPLDLLLDVPQHRHGSGFAPQPSVVNPAWT